VEEAFKFYDHDGDWRITAEDLERVATEEATYGDLLGEGKRDGLKQMLSKVDTDGSGWVSLEEFDNASALDFKMTKKTDNDQAETQKVMKALKKLTATLSLAERGNLSMLEQLQRVRQNAKAARRQAKQAKQASHKTKLQAGWPWSRRRSPPSPVVTEAADHGEVSQIYTFGAPSTADPPLQNGRAGNGLFEGLRVVSNDREPGVFWGYWMKTDPVTWLSGVVGYEHALMDVLVLKEFDLMEPEHKSFLSTSDLHSWPGSDSPLWHFDLHYSSTYGALAAAQAHWPVVERMLQYSNEVYNSEEALHQAAQAHGARLVEYSIEQQDRVGLIQDESTLACTLVFAGSDNTEDWLNNANIIGRTFCGFEDVHSGFRAEMRAILSTQSWQNQFSTKLPKCGKVYVAGHSLGGAIAELFAACANNVNVPSDDEDASRIQWKPATPVLMNTKGTLLALANASSA